MWLRRLTLQNFRGFAALDLDLDRRLTVLVGVNGAGKSSILRAAAAVADNVQFSFAQRTHSSGVRLDFRDRRVGAEKTEIVGVVRHGRVDGDMRISSTSQSDRWEFMFHNRVNIDADAHRPFAFLVSTNRHVESADLRDRRSVDAAWEDLGVTAPAPGYERFVEWFKECEDVENEQRVQARDLDLQDAQLRAVREAIAALMPGLEGVHIRRDPKPALVAKKGETELRLDQLSDGERNLVALAGDLARRMVIAAGKDTNPLELEGVVLIDEIEQHLHPAWQRRVLPALMRAFPNTQFIVTTHSPQVLSSVPADSVVLLDNFEARSVTQPTRGRDSNAILREVFGVPERPVEQLESIRHARDLIAKDRLDEAREQVEQLAEALSEQDDEIVDLRIRLHVAEAGE